MRKEKEKARVDEKLLEKEWEKVERKKRALRKGKRKVED